MPYRREDSPVWWVSFTAPGGKRVRCTTGTTDRKEAQALEAKWKLEAYRAEMWDEQRTYSFDELMLAYVRVSAKDKKAPERDRYSLKHLYPYFTGRSLNTLSAGDVRRYVAKRLGAGAGHSTINREIGLLSAAINYARREWDWDIPNPVTGRRLREPEGRTRWLRRDEAARLLTAAKSIRQAPHLWGFIQLALNTGMRTGEMLGLEWKRVDLQSNLIYLGGIHQKSGRRSSIPLNGPAREAILWRAKFLDTHCPSGAWVFCNRGGDRIGTVKHSFATACRIAKIEDFHPHDLRHTCAAWLVQCGVPLIEVRDLLRHASVQMTERYAHLAPQNVRAAVALLETGSHDLVTPDLRKDMKLIE